MGHRSDGVADDIGDFERMPEHLGSADHVAICLPLTARTRGLFDAATIARMKPTAYLYNIGRGPIVETQALVTALQEGRLGGAGLDVTDPEPLPADHPLLSLENCLVVPHIASASIKTRDAMSELAADNIINVLSGRAPKTPVNKEVVEQKGLR